MPRIAWINAAPVKGLALQTLEATELTIDGVPGDRCFHVVDARGRMINGKRLGRLVRVAAAWDSGRLTLMWPDGSTVTGTVALGEPIGSSFYGRPRPGRIVDGPWAAALSELAGEPVRLVQSARAGTGVDRGRGGAVSLLSIASLAALGDAASAGSLDQRRFRMTFGIDGIDAHDEDAWLDRDVRIGDAVVRPAGNTGRCLVTGQDPDTGVADVDTLAALRRIRPAGTTEPLALGVHGAVVRPGLVRLGDPVSVA